MAEEKEIYVHEIDKIPQGTKIEVFSTQSVANLILPLISKDNILIVFAPRGVIEFFEPYLQVPKMLGKYVSEDYPYWYPDISMVPEIVRKLERTVGRANSRPTTIYFSFLVPSLGTIKKLFAIPELTVILEGMVSRFPHQDGKLIPLASDYIGYTPLETIKLWRKGEISRELDKITSEVYPNLLLRKGDEYFYVRGE